MRNRRLIRFTAARARAPRPVSPGGGAIGAAGAGAMLAALGWLQGTLTGRHPEGAGR